MSEKKRKKWTAAEELRVVLTSMRRKKGAELFFWQMN